MKLSEGLKDFFNQREQLSKGFNAQKVLKVFNEVVGLSLQKHIKKSYFKNGVLYIAISTPTLKNELSYAKEKLIQNINKKMGGEVLNKLVIVENLK